MIEPRSTCLCSYETFLFLETFCISIFSSLPAYSPCNRVVLVFKISGDVIPLLRTLVAGYTSSKMQILTQLMRSGSYLPFGSLNGDFSLGSSPSQFLISVLLVSVWWRPPDHASHEQSSEPPSDGIVGPVVLTAGCHGTCACSLAL